MKISRAWKIMICKILTLSSHIKQHLCSNRGWLESQCEKCRHLKKCHHLRAHRRKARWWSRWGGTTSSLRSKSFVARRVPARRRRPSPISYFVILFARAKNKKENGNFLWKFVVPLQTHAGGQWLVSFCFAFFLYILHINYWQCIVAFYILTIGIIPEHWFSWSFDSSRFFFFAKNVKNLYQKHY